MRPVTHASASAAPFRSVCYRCHKPSVVCVCPTIPQVQNRTGVIIVQHPRERFHPIGTVRFAELGLARVQVLIHGPGRRGEEPAAPLSPELPPRTGLLYPAPGAPVLSEIPPTERPEHLVVLDGTWSQAKSLYRALPWLEAVPHFSLAPETPGQYRIRREPTDEALSTIEAIVGALQILEPETPGLDGLLSAFARMIDRQIAYARLERPRHKRGPRRPPSNPIPPELRAAPERVVLGYGEFVPPVGGPGAGPHELVYWAAERLGTGERFAAYIRPATFSAERPAERQLRHMQLARADVGAAAPPERFVADWLEFFRPDDILATWNQSTHDFLAPLLPRVYEAMFLKAAYCNTRRAKCGALEDVIAREGLEPRPTPFPGRPGLVMGRLLALGNLLAALAPNAGLELKR